MYLSATRLRRNISFALQDAHWRDVVDEANCTLLVDRPITNNERKRRDAAWELFTSECVFLLDHLMTLKHVRSSNDIFVLI